MKILGFLVMSIYNFFKNIKYNFKIKNILKNIFYYNNKI